MSGKGDKWRKGTNYEKYYNSPFWNSREKTMESKEEKKYLFLDDVREPGLTYLWDEDIKLVEYSGIPACKWSVVRSYDEFVNWINEHGIPDVVSFDNDLFDMASPDVDDDLWHDSMTMWNWRDFPIKTGAHCVEYLADLCVRKNHPIPVYYVHSANSAARPIIREIMENAKQKIQFQKQ